LLVLARLRRTPQRSQLGCLISSSCVVEHHLHAAVVFVMAASQASFIIDTILSMKKALNRRQDGKVAPKSALAPVESAFLEQRLRVSTASLILRPNLQAQIRKRRSTYPPIEVTSSSAKLLSSTRAKRICRADPRSTGR
jgi:hypothetical protein